MTQRILFATANPAKLGQFRFVCEHLGSNFQIVSLKSIYGEDTDYEEIGTTPQEIAENGARHLFEKFQVPIITEDSITQIKALGNLPGLRSKAFLREHGRSGTLKMLEKAGDRSAKLSSAVTYFDGTIMKTFTHVVEGVMAHSEAFLPGAPDWIGPTNHPMGGGFNAIFIPHGLTRTLAQTTAQEGMRWGYREKNFKDLLEFLTKEKNGDHTITIAHLKEKIKTFCEERDWDQFHNAKELAVALSIEASELLEIFRWKTRKEVDELFKNEKKREEIEDELADVVYFPIRLAQLYNIDLSRAIEKKMRKNNEKYPADKVKGLHKKYNEYD